MEDFSQILTNYLSSNNLIRSKAEMQLNIYLERGDPTDLGRLFDSLNCQYDPQVKLFLSILIKKVFDSCIGEGNINNYREYIISNKSAIVNTILNVKADLKTINFLVIILGQMLNLFKDIEEETNAFTYDEVFEYIFQFYNYHKSSGNVDETFQGLFISFKLLKIIKNWEDKIHYGRNRNRFIIFYEKIIFDFTEILVHFISGQVNDTSQHNLEISLQYINLYFKLSKHSLNFMLKDQREQIMALIFNFLNKVLTSLLHEITNQNLRKSLFESIFIANKILLKYTAFISNMDVCTIKRFAELFYIYIEEQRIFENLQQMITQMDNPFKEVKFLSDIIDFFRELFQLTSFYNWGELVIFKDCFSDDSVKISDFLTKDFFKEDRVKKLMVFSIQNCLVFKTSEIEMAANDVEEFYQWYDTLSPAYDLREKAGALCRIIYDKHKKSLKDFFESLEFTLLNLTEKELLNISSGYPGLDFNETNLRCAILSCFEVMSFVYFNKHRNYSMWIKTILLKPLDCNLILNTHCEVFSRFIIMRILMKIIDYQELKEYKEEIFLIIYELFLKLNSNASNFFLLLKFSIIDFLYAYFDDVHAITFPGVFLPNFIIQACDLLKTTCSPDIQSKIIKTTIVILDKFSDEDIESSFPLIFPILSVLWQNNWNEFMISQNQNKPILALRKGQSSSVVSMISVVRQNLIKLITIFVKRIGVFVKFTEDNTSQGPIVADINYFNFVYNLIGYSITIKSQESSFLVTEALRLILLIQGEFYNLTAKNLTSQTKSAAFHSYLQYYVKIYDYFPIILENLSTSDDYFLVQFLVIEQYLALLTNEEVKNTVHNFHVIENIINIINNFFGKHIISYHQTIFNFVEFCLYIFNSLNDVEYSLHFNDFVYQIIDNILLSTDEDNLIYTLTQMKKNSEENEVHDMTSMECPQLEMYIGALQLANRLMYINYQKDILSYDFTIRLARCLNVITSNKNIMNDDTFISLLKRKIISNLIGNLSQVMKRISEKGIRISDNDFFSGALEMTNRLKEEYGSKSHYLEKSEHTLSHWLFFFNKMNNREYYYNFSTNEDKYRLFWASKFEQTSYFECDLTDIVFELKYNSLANDTMFKED